MLDKNKRPGDENMQSNMQLFGSTNKYKPPRKRYTKNTFKLDAQTFYMKCPGCNYIVVFPKPLPSFIDQSMKQKDGSMMSIWLPGKNDGHILELNNIQFSSDFKKNHHYKVMQAQATQKKDIPKIPSNLMHKCFT